MSKFQATLLKANILGGMNSFVLDVIGDEITDEYWFRYGLPDGCDEEMLMEIAEDNDLFAQICSTFNDITKIFCIE